MLCLWQGVSSCPPGQRHLCWAPPRPWGLLTWRGPGVEVSVSLVRVSPPPCGVGTKSVLSLSVNEAFSHSSSPRSCRTSRCCRSSGTGCGRSPGRRKVGEAVAQRLWGSAHSVPSLRPVLAPTSGRWGPWGALAGPRASGRESLGPGLQSTVADSEPHFGRGAWSRGPATCLAVVALTSPRSECRDQAQASRPTRL